MATQQDESRLVEKFNGTKFSLWKWRMRHHLDYKGLLSIVEGDEQHLTVHAANLPQTLTR